MYLLLSFSQGRNHFTVPGSGTFQFWRAKNINSDGILWLIVEKKYFMALHFKLVPLTIGAKIWMKKGRMFLFCNCVNILRFYDGMII